MRYLLLSLVFTAIARLCAAQSLPITIAVSSEADGPLAGATVQLSQIALDSASWNEITGVEGLAVFPNREPGPYRVRISYIGYGSLEKTVTAKAEESRFEFTLEEAAVDLGEVTVRARRPLMRQEGDKTIIDPEPLADLSTNTLELLESTPGLFVDQDGNIYLNSATPAAIYINGREQRMSTQDIASILQSLPTGSILRIEVLRTPSSKYDAASSGGIVNVVLKKGVKIGRTGSVRAGMNQGERGNRYVGFSLNDSGERATYYLNTNYSRNNTVQDLQTTRFFTADSSLQQQARSELPRHLAYLGYGLNYDISPKFSFSYDGRANVNFSETATQNRNTISGPEGNLLTENDNRIDNESVFLSLQQDLGAVYKFDSLGSEWDTKLGYTFSRGNNDQDYESRFLLPARFGLMGEGENVQQRHFLLFQSDLTYQLPVGVKLETGIKGTLQSYSSEANYFIGSNGSLQVDPLRTNAFDYEERIGAAYLQGGKSLPGRIYLKAGLRLEHTYMRGNQTVPTDTSFLINRSDWFPYVYLSRPIMSIAGYELNAYLIYRRTIDRPGYQSLSPYVKYIDQYLYETGNPSLRPQFTDNYEANISFDDMPIFAIGRNYTTDIFSDVVYQDERFDNVAVRTFDNLGTNRETYFRIVGAIPPGGTYFFVVGAQYNLNEYEGLYEGQPLAFSRGSWRFFSFHSLSLTKLTKLTASGFLMLKGQQNFYELGTFGQLNIGLRQQLFNKKLQISLNARDVLRTMVTRFTLAQGNIVTEGERYSDNQRFGINLRYSFGIKRKEENGKGMPFEAEIE